MMIDAHLNAFEKSDVFTPEEIAKRMVSYLSGEGTVLDPAVGTGNLIRYLPETYTKIEVYDIKQPYLDKCPQKANLLKNTADYLKEPNNETYDNIIVNPPYIKIQDLSPEYRGYIKEKWKKYSAGSFDIYIIFLVKCLEQLKDTGTMVSITPNSYLYNKSCKSFREEIIVNRYIKEIIDFKEAKVFPGTSVYTCIMVMTKEPKDTFIYNGEEVEYETIVGPEYNIFQGMNNSTSTSSSTKTLSDICKIKNGVATLCNEVYIHSEKMYDEPCWRRCKTSSDDKWIIYPYDEMTAKVFDEPEMKEANPRTYEYLETQKPKLSNRDKGNKEYPKWYSYGRSQSIRLPSRDQVIYIPVFIDPTNIQYTIDIPTVYSGCLCIELTTDEYTNEEVVETIKNNIEYIKSNSSKRGGGWINLSTKTLLSVPINE